ncbi:MAG: LysR family transcriptional regulator [Marinosulfonomonas sp.]
MADHPNLSGLRAFEAAARHGSFARAAEELGLSPAAISAQIRKLEAEMGVALFHRGHRAVALTEQGEAYARRVIDAFALLAPSGSLAAFREPRVTVELDAEFCRQWLLPRLTPDVLDELAVHLNLRRPKERQVSNRSFFV